MQYLSCSLFFYGSLVSSRNVRSKCEYAHTVQVGMVLVVRPYVNHIYIVTNIQAQERQYKFHHLTCLREARFAHQLNKIFIFLPTWLSSAAKV